MNTIFSPATARALLSLLLLASSGACSRDPMGPDDVLTRCTILDAQQSLEVIGCGVAAPVPFTAEVAVAGGRAYTTTYAFGSLTPGNHVNIWDVTGPTPTLLDTLMIPGAVLRTSDVSIADDGRLMVVSTEPAGTLAIFELSDGRKPRLLTVWSVPEVGSPGIHTAKFARIGETLYVFAQASSPLEGVSIIDMSSPAAPALVGRLSASNYIHDVFVRGGLVFAADWDAGIGIWDVGGGGRGGSPAAPVLIGHAPTLNGNAHNVWWFHDPTAMGAQRRRYLFVGEEQGGDIGSSSAGDLHVVDITDVTAPREVATYGVDGAGAHNFSMDEPEGILYAAFYNGGVRALDVRGDLSACTPEQRAPSGLCDLRKMGRERAFALADAGAYIWGVQFAGDAVYASDMLNGIWKLKPVVR